MCVCMRERARDRETERKNEVARHKCFFPSYLGSEISTNLPVPFLISTLKVDLIELENYGHHQESRNKVDGV